MSESWAHDECGGTGEIVEVIPRCRAQKGRDMTDELREAIHWVECELRPYEGHPDLLPEPAKLVLSAARAHLGCSTITDEPTGFMKLLRVYADEIDALPLDPTDRSKRMRVELANVAAAFMRSAAVELESLYRGTET